MTPIPITIIFTLVHGTSAPRAPWTQEGSSLRDTLQEALAPACVLFRAPEWSGHNRQSKRREAALELVEEFKRTHKAYPAAKHFVIAHSHGGNIVRDALEESGIEDFVDGVFTLNTPFIETLKRDEDSFLWGLHFLLFFAVTALGINFIWPTYSFLFSFGTLLLVLAALFVLRSLRRCIREMGRFPRAAVSEESRRLLRELSHETSSHGVPEEFLDNLRPCIPVRFFCLVSAADETISFFSCLQGLANIPHFIFHRSFLPWVLAILILLLIAFVPMVLIDWVQPRPVITAVLLTPWLLFALLLAGVVFGVAFRLTLGLPISLRAIVEDLIAHHWVVSHVPLSSMMVIFHDYRPDLMEAPQSELLHSSIYESDFSLIFIQFWIKNLLDYTQPDGSPDNRVITCHRPTRAP